MASCQLHYEAGESMGSGVCILHTRGVFALRGAGPAQRACCWILALRHHAMLSLHFSCNWFTAKACVLPVSRPCGVGPQRFQALGNSMVRGTGGACSL